MLFLYILLVTIQALFAMKLHKQFKKISLTHIIIAIIIHTVKINIVKDMSLGSIIRALKGYCLYLNKQ